MLASGVTALAGFAVLIASDIAMLRDFGLVTVIDLAVSLLGVLAVLPAVLVAGRAPRRRPRRPPPPRASRREPARVAVAVPPRPRRLLLAVFVVALMGWITLNTLPRDSPGSQGLPAGAALPPFAMPLSSSSCRGRCDANVAQRRPGRRRRAPGLRGARAARS